jgi:outer membrane immunogenic protein
MKKLLSSVALSAFLAAPAMAADLPARMPVKAPPAMVAAMYNWSGFYIGAHAGYGWADSEWEFVDPVFTTDHRVRGFVGGGHVGFNWQSGNFVFGIEGSVSLTRMDGSSLCPAPFSCETDVDHFWRAGARAGIAAGPTGNWLFYGTGGFARAKLDTKVVVAGIEFGDSTHHHGWFGGAGIEWGITPNFTLGVEAYHVSLGGERHFTPGGVIVANTRDVDFDFTVVQARATYRFNWGGPVVARY